MGWAGTAVRRRNVGCRYLMRLAFLEFPPAPNHENHHLRSHGRRPALGARHGGRGTQRTAGRVPVRAPAHGGCGDRPDAGAGAVGAQSRPFLRARTDRRCAPGVLRYCRNQEKRREERSVGSVTALTGTAASSQDVDSVSSRARDKESTGSTSCSVSQPDRDCRADTRDPDPPGRRL